MKPEPYETEKEYIVRFTLEKTEQYPDPKKRIEAAKLAWKLAKSLENKLSGKIITK